MFPRGWRPLRAHPRCRLKAKLVAAREVFMRELDATTLADVLIPGRRDVRRQERPGEAYQRHRGICRRGA